ncbi:MAG: DEAD/DEAH box helicase [Candidatus Limnocylindrales bacterium]
MSFDGLGLSPELLRAVADQGYEIPTPVQERAIPLVLEGRDVLAAAQTGTGKTAAFVLPMLQRLQPATKGDGQAPDPGDGRGQRPARDGRAGRDSRWSPIRALVLTPTRELALQVEESIRTYGARRPIRSTTIYGGVGFDPQVRALRAGPGIVVATPGRLLDHVEQRTIDLSNVEILVLDEADRMLDMGFIQPIRRILALLPTERQNLLFSATFSDEVRQLAGGILHDPASVEVAPRNTAAELVDQLVMPVDRERKRELLSHLVKTRRVDQALVFTRTKHGANRLAGQLDQDGIAAAAIHGNKSQSQRVRALNDFKAGRILVLVATDLAARGIDIESLPHVVNFELPVVASDYVHRIGRTGRAGIDGQAISLVCVDEAPLLRDIERLLRHPIPAEVVPGFEPDRSIRPEPIRLRSAPPPRQQPGRPQNGWPQAGRPQAGRQQATRQGAWRPQSGRPQPGRPGAQPRWSGEPRPSHAPRPHGVGRPKGASRPQNGRPGESYRPHKPAPWQSRDGNVPSDGRPRSLPGERLQRDQSGTDAGPRRD